MLTTLSSVELFFTIKLSSKIISFYGFDDPLPFSSFILFLTNCCSFQFNKNVRWNHWHSSFLSIADECHWYCILYRWNWIRVQLTSSCLSSIRVQCIIANIFFCKLSENITTDLEEIGDAFYNCPWYFLAVSQQKTFVLPIHRSQKTYRLTGLGIVSCSLDIFLSVSIALVQLIRSLLLLAQNVI